ncbi:MAG: hypothetical protein Q7S19_02645 [bacterium]|nr:hypothetical protein [bacterium]
MNKDIIIATLVVVILLGYQLDNKKGAEEVTITPKASPELRADFIESKDHSHLADIAELSCFPNMRYDCNLDGCKPGTPGTYYFLDYGIESGTYFRCDKKGCDSYPVTVTESGDYTNFTPVNGQAMLFKVANKNASILSSPGEFVDIATIGTQSLISTGKCE